MRNSPQKKEQVKVMARDLFKTDIRNMLDPEFKAKITKVLAEHDKLIEDTLTAEIKDQKRSRQNKKTHKRDAKPTGGNDDKGDRNRKKNK